MSTELDELKAIAAAEEEDWEASRLAEVFIDMVESRDRGELNDIEFMELMGDMRTTELMWEEAEMTQMRQKLVKVAETLAKFA
jgi:hypothetical protein